MIELFALRRIEETPKRYVLAFLLTAGLVILWGVGHRLYDALIPLFAGFFDLTGIRHGVAQSIYGIVYVFGAIPAALYARRFGYKAAIQLGLGFLAAGAFTFYPAAETRNFGFLLAAVTAMAVGWVVLETAANPLFAAFGSVERAIFRLNLAQCLFPLGAIIGFLAGSWIVHQGMALPQAGARFAISHPYIVVGALVLLFAFLIEETEYPAAAREREPGGAGIRMELKQLLSERTIIFAIAAQAAAIMAFVALWSQPLPAPSPLLEGWPRTSHIFLLGMITYAAGRFTGTALMWRIQPAKVLFAFMALSAMAALAALFASNGARLTLSLAVSFFLSISWPTVLGLALEGRSGQMKIITGFLTASGALAGVVCHIVIALTGSAAGVNFVVVAASVLLVAAFAYWMQKRTLSPP